MDVLWKLKKGSNEIRTPQTESSPPATGMGPVTEMASSSAKIFSSLYALYSGVAFLSITAVFFAPIIHRLLHILHVENDDIEN